VRLVAPRTDEQQRLETARRPAEAHKLHCADIEKVSVAFQPDTVAIGLISGIRHVLAVALEIYRIEVVQKVHAMHVIKVRIEHRSHIALLKEDLGESTLR
jgi:hypothetical protein